MPIEFSVNREDFVHALKPFFAGKARGKVAEQDYVDATASGTEVEFVYSGFSSTVVAEIGSSGCARIPFAFFETLFRNPAKLAWSSTGHIAIRITDGKIQAGATTFNHPEVSMRTVGARVADLPADASLHDALALTLRFSEQELRDSGVWDRIEAARNEATERIEKAMKILGPLNVTEETLRIFVWDRISKPEEKLRL